MNSSKQQAAQSLQRACRHIDAREWESARSLLQSLLSSGPQSPEVYNHYGRVLNNLGQLDEARQAFASAIALQPDYAEAHNNLGHILRAQGQYAAAEEHFARAVALQPDYAKAHFNRASALNLLERNEEAVASLQAGLRLSPGDAMAHFNLATLYRLLDQYPAARLHFHEALRLRPDFAEARVGLAGLQVHLGEIDPALETYQAVLESEPGNVDARIGIADILDLKGERDKALAGLSAIVATEADTSRLAVARARLEKNAGRHQQALQTLLAARQQDPAACAEMPGFFYCLGDVCDKLGRYDEAMQNYAQANSLKHEKFDAGELVSAIDSLIKVFSKDRLARPPTSGNASQRPVFIVGMPRSGTSLVEQILASHPRVFGAGELNIIVDMVRELGRGAAGRYPESVQSLDAGALSGLARRYLAALDQIDSLAERVTDKLPHNFLHLGLIALLFPNCRVIHCRRDYRDTALSCYFQNFSSSSMAFTNRLEDIGAYYRQYLRLMAHWQTALNVPMHEVQYEALVANQEVESRKLVDFIGLDWDPACLKFHATERFVNTASHAQVTRPIYRTSVARYSNYASHLDALLKAVAEPQ